MKDQIQKVKTFFLNKLQVLKNSVIHQKMSAKRDELTEKYPEQVSQVTTFVAIGFLLVLTTLVVLILSVYANRLKQGDRMFKENLLTRTFDNLFNNSNVSSSPTPNPTIKPLPHGRQLYSYSHGPLTKGPKPSKATIDPIDPKMNQEQYLSIKIEHDKEVTSATGTLITDNQEKNFKMELISGTKTNGVWGAKWRMTDTYLHRYQIKYVFKDKNETHQGALTFR